MIPLNIQCKWYSYAIRHNWTEIVLFLSLNVIVVTNKHSTEIVLYILFLSLNAIVGAIRNGTEIVLFLLFFLFCFFVCFVFFH